MLTRKNAERDIHVYMTSINIKNDYCTLFVIQELF